MRAYFLFLLLFLPAAVAPAQDQSRDLRAQLDAPCLIYTLSARGLADAVMRVSKEFRLPAGIEWVRDKRSFKPLQRTWNSETPRQILSSIVRAYPGYALVVGDSVIHVFRRDLLADKGNFLNLKVPDSFTVHRQRGGLANMRLRRVVQNMIAASPSPPGAGEAFEYATGIHEKPLTLSLAGLTIREALDRLSSASEHNIWVVTFSDDPESVPSGFRRTLTLWHPTPLPISQQPVWDFLAWAEPLPTSSEKAD